MNKVIDYKNNNINNINEKTKIILNNISKSINKNQQIDTLLNTNKYTRYDLELITDKLTIINEYYNIIDIEFQDLISNIENNDIIAHNLNKNDIIDYKKSKEILKPFLPYMLYFSLINDKNI